MERKGTKEYFSISLSSPLAFSSLGAELHEYENRKCSKNPAWKANYWKCISVVYRKSHALVRVRPTSNRSVKRTVKDELEETVGEKKKNVSALECIKKRNQS